MRLWRDESGHCTAGRVARVAGGLVLTLGCGVGCNLLAGIDEGTLVDAGADSGGRHDGGADTGRDGTTGHEGGGHDGANDVTSTTDTGKGGKDGSTPPADAAPVAFACGIAGGRQPTLLLDLAAVDAGTLEFAGGSALFVVPGPNLDPYIVAQLQNTGSGNDSYPFFVFDLHGDGSYNAGAFQGASGNRLGLLDVHSVPGATLGGATIEVLTSYSTVDYEDTLQLVTLPQVWSGNSSGIPQPEDASSRILALNANTHSNNYSAAQIVQWPPRQDGGSPVGYLALENDQAHTVSQVVFGPGGDAGESAIAQGPWNNSTLSSALAGTFFALDATAYAFPSAVDVDGGGDAAYVELTGQATSAGTISSAVRQGPLTFAPSGTAYVFQELLSTHPSSTEPGKVVLLAVAAESMAGPFSLFGGTVSVEALPGLVIGEAPTFTTVMLATAPVANGGTAWGSDDSFVIAGGAPGTTSALGLLWLSSSVRSIAQLTLARPNPIGDTAVSFMGSGSQTTGATFQLAWTEEPSGNNRTQLWTASVTCTPKDGG